MALITRYVDADSTAGGNGTTNSIIPADPNRAYVSLNAWEAAEQQNLTDGGGDIAECICESNGVGHTADTSALAINGWTTAVGNYITIYTSAAARHDGKWNTGKHRLVVPNTSIMDIYEDYVRLDGLQIATTFPTSSANHGIIAESGLSGSIYVSNTIVWGHGNAAYYQTGILALSGTVNIWNVIICGLHPSLALVRGVNVDGATADIYSTTVGGGSVGIRRASGTVICKNTYAGGATTCYSGTITMTTCASSDATGSPGLTGIAYDTDTFVNVGAGTEDLHLAADGLSPLQDVGTDTSGDPAPLNFTTDIDGQTRSGTWDVGADEYVAAGGAPIGPLIDGWLTGGQLAFRGCNL